MHLIAINGIQEQIMEYTMRSVDAGFHFNLCKFITIDASSRMFLSGLLHVSNITRSRVTSVSDLLAVGENVKVLVVKSMFPDKISLR